MLHKCFNGLRISDQAKLLASRCGLSASTGSLFAAVRAPQGRDLPSLRRKAPEVCRKTHMFGAASPAIPPKPLHRHAIPRQAKRGFSLN
jgi:hypothetical protein